MMNLSKIPFSKVLPAGVEVDTLLNNLQEWDDFDFPPLYYDDGKFTWGYADKEYDELEGIIFFYQRQRGRFRDSIDQKEGQRLLCKSRCGKKGYTFIGGGDNGLILTPEDGIECYRCPHAKITDALSLRVCRKQIKLFFLVKGNCIPHTLYLDPKTTENFINNYIMKLTMNGFFYFEVVTKIILKNDKPDFQIVGRLEGKHLETRDSFYESMKKDNTLYESQFLASFPNGKVVKCTCDIWKHGCICGVMQRERLKEKK
jgi:hypothetical protein